MIQTSNKCAPVSPLEISEPLREHLRIVSDACIRCDLCQKECAFLKKYGKPGDVADRYDPGRTEDQGMPFECSLCGLCAEVCPKGLDPAELFLHMRAEAVRRGGGDFPEHAALTGYERHGTSRAYSYYGLPEGCDTVFFPGCALAGSRSDKIILAYRVLRERIPSLGIVLDCCMKPSHDLGREAHAAAMFGEMRNYLVTNGVRNILVACPNCYKMFARYGHGLAVKTIYEVLAEGPVAGKGGAPDRVTVHDPCAIRFETGIHRSARKLIEKRGYTVEEMIHAGRRTLCCGEGGAVGALNGAFAENWGKRRRAEAAGRMVVTYCAGCASRLSRLTPTVHILDVLWDGEAGKAKVAKAPFTYWKRLQLKRWFRTHVPAAITRERTCSGTPPAGKSGLVKLAVFLLFLAAAVSLVEAFDVSRYLEHETLRALIQRYGALAPLIYLLVYAIAPAFFLPGLPITIAGGLLFGPLWGVVYTITGSTAGACIAFLISRYLARDWVAGKLKSPRWRRLDEGVEKHGWKVVAFTRLIPLFPFNLLNYAFGLTRIGFLPYAVTTFFCMLPACIAFIVFSSSLLDLVRGRISPAFLLGVVLVALVSLVPFFYRRCKAKHGGEAPL